jgi:hypothetical protein
MLTRQHPGTVLRPPAGDATALLNNLKHFIDHTDQHRLVSSGRDISARELADAYTVCDQLTRKHSKSFYFSTMFLPPAKRQAIRALYAFCRTSDDIVDMAAGNAPHALAHWVTLVHARTTPLDNPVLIAWNDTVTKYNISQELVDELLAGIAMDLTVTRYQTFDDLWLYCYRVASVVGLISMQIIWHDYDAVDYAVKLGVACWSWAHLHPATRLSAIRLNGRRYFAGASDPSIQGVDPIPKCSCTCTLRGIMAWYRLVASGQSSRSGGGSHRLPWYFGWHSYQ